MIEQSYVVCFGDNFFLLISKHHGKIIAKDKQNKIQPKAKIG
jgi:hypothetical protein